MGSVENDHRITSELNIYVTTLPCFRLRQCGSAQSDIFRLNRGDLARIIDEILVETCENSSNTR